MDRVDYFITFVIIPFVIMFFFILGHITGYGQGQDYMKEQAVLNNVATWEADENGEPLFSFKIQVEK